MAKWLLVSVLLAGCSSKGPEAPVKVTDAASPVYDAIFWKTWGDGFAELTSYDLKYPRYGASRQGTAVSLFTRSEFANVSATKIETAVPCRGAP